MNNYPPGTTGSEREIVGLTEEEERICSKCSFTNGFGECAPNRNDCPLTLKECVKMNQREVDNLAKIICHIDSKIKGNIKWKVMAEEVLKYNNPHRQSLLAPFKDEGKLKDKIRRLTICPKPFALCPASRECPTCELLTKKVDEYVDLFKLYAAQTASIVKEQTARDIKVALRISYDKDDDSEMISWPGAKKYEEIFARYLPVKEE
jgi:hypothetical protein